jgi:hypothetical protein
MYIMKDKSNNHLYERDSKIKSLEKMIDNRKKILRENLNDIRKSTNENAFLVDIADDYVFYYKKINNDKEKKLEYLNNLSNYLKELLRDNHNSKEMKKNIKDDHKIIMREIQKIQNDIM